MRILVLLLLVVMNCPDAIAAPVAAPTAPAPPRAAAVPPVRTGADILRAEGFARLAGVRYGLVTNSTAVTAGRPLIGQLAAAPPAVIFTPEHGLAASDEDGVRIGNGSVDGIPVISLYGDKKQPAAADLEGLQLLVFDIQDIGVRFYTYISTMGLAMQAAARAGIPFMVLDRPNPLGGEYLGGFVHDSLPRAFTSLYPLPVAHGLTVGELAGMIRGEKWLAGLERLDLRVVRMAGWERWMRWPDTGLAWVPTSPNIPDFTAALLYPGLGLLEGTRANEGRGTREQFRLAGLPGIDAGALAAALNREGHPGLRFEPVRYTPVSLPGFSTTPKWSGRELGGVRVVVEDFRRVRPVEAGLAVMTALYAAAGAELRAAFFTGGVDDMAGSVLARQAAEAAFSPVQSEGLSAPGLAAFDRLRKPYLLY